MRHFLDIDKTERDDLKAILAQARAMKAARGDVPKATPGWQAKPSMRPAPRTSVNTSG